MTGIVPVAVRQPRVRDRASGGGERIRYSPLILPRCSVHICLRGAMVDADNSPMGSRSVGNSALSQAQAAA